MKPRNILRCRLLVFGIPWIKRDYDARRGEGVISNRVNVVFVGIRFGNVFLWYDVQYDAPRDLRLGMNQLTIYKSNCYNPYSKKTKIIQNNVQPFDFFASY